MNVAVQRASLFLDEPWRRLVWIAPLSVAIWTALLLGFALLLKQTAPPLPEMKPIEARIVELPPVVGGLQGGPAAAPHPVAPAPPKSKPHVEVRRKVIAKPHPHKERMAPEAPPSVSGTQKGPGRIEQRRIQGDNGREHREWGRAAGEGRDRRRVGARQRQPWCAGDLFARAEDSG